MRYYQCVAVLLPMCCCITANVLPCCCPCVAAHVLLTMCCCITANVLLCKWCFLVQNMPLVELQIRPATKSDIPKVTVLEEEVSKEESWTPYSEDLLGKLRMHMDVLLVDASVIGFCIHHMLDKSTVLKMKRLGFDFGKGRRKKTCHITNIAVHKDWRHRGFGQRLVKAALRKHSSHSYVRYTSTGEGVHCIQKALLQSYDPSESVVKEYVYDNGKDAMRYVYKKR